MLRTLLQPRYAALSVLMLIVAAICTAAGVWQVARLGEKIAANGDLRHNAHAAAAPVADVLPLVGTAKPHTDSIEYRTVTASGIYLANEQVLVRQRSVNSDTGYLVLTPLKTTTGPTLLIVRGFVSGASGGNATPTVAAPPTSEVTVTARVQPTESRDDQFAALRNGQVESINASQQAQRLGTPTYDGYAQLESKASGTEGLVEIPAPDLSNPAGGAIEPQHLAYVIQWFLFAALALAAPLVMARAETRRSPRAALDDDEEEQADDSPSNDLEGDLVAARLAERYGRSNRRLR